MISVAVRPGFVSTDTYTAYMSIKRTGCFVGRTFLYGISCFTRGRCKLKEARHGCGFFHKEVTIRAVWISDMLHTSRYRSLICSCMFSGVILTRLRLDTVRFPAVPDKNITIVRETFGLGSETVLLRHTVRQVFKDVFVRVLQPKIACDKILAVIDILEWPSHRATAAATYAKWTNNRNALWNHVLMSATLVLNPTKETFCNLPWRRNPLKRVWCR